YISSTEEGGRQVIEDALKFRQDGIPCHWICLDIGWMHKFRTKEGHVQLDNHKFTVSPDSQSSTFIHTLLRNGFQLSVVFICQEDLTAYDEQGRSWYDQYQSIVAQGVYGFKIPSANQTTPHPDWNWANGMNDNEAHN